ncbi:hypothetical protein V2G26_003654 [Clonostachys chloroleuca]
MNHEEGTPEVEKVCNGSDADAERLAEMGCVQDLKRNFSVWSVLDVGFSLTNSWWGVSAALITGINSGGSCLLVYGTFLLALVSIGVAVSFSELVSAMPNAAGQIFWLAWAGSICACATVSLSVASAAIGCYQLSHPEFEIRPWHTIVGYQTANIVVFFFNCYGRILPKIAAISLYTTSISFVVILITVPSVATTHQDAKFVFATFINNTGWSQDTMEFILGLINPERAIPIAIMGTVGIGFVTSFGFILSMMFGLSNFDAVSTTLSGVPILELFYQALQNRAGAIVLESLVIATGVGCLAACHTWQSRLCWTFARDGGLPFSLSLAKVHPRLDVPLNAHITSCILDSILGCLYLVSTTAFNAILTGCIEYQAWAILVAFFWMGIKYRPPYINLYHKRGYFRYSFPSYLPATADNMNYISAVYGFIIVAASLDWIFRGRKVFRTHPKLGEM